MEHRLAAVALEASKEDVDKAIKVKSMSLDLMTFLGMYGLFSEKATNGVFCGRILYEEGGQSVVFSIINTTQLKLESPVEARDVLN
ncbi:hypothetical protein TNIN_458341 [Trichonephila inaurata madagascariensis]|uniref:Uncharacterized protein n=1 Tax=Trichonephila inaurata madagascariensis TaxID=2747483 RepID=A0A8X6Y416_9ARAC|nr:hypothetical protein TNIN_458341 [Trichonephila inaurata madagascariensis]